MRPRPAEPSTTALAATLAPALAAATVGAAAATVGAAAPTVTYFVDVTNTGTVDADDVVLGFLVPPNAGQDGTPLQTLFGFERVHVKAGETVTVWLYPSLTEFAPVGASGERRALPGEYTVSIGVPGVKAMGYVEARLLTA